jgi:hypothetical protein
MGYKGIVQRNMVYITESELDVKYFLCDAA